MHPKGMGRYDAPANYTLFRYAFSTPEALLIPRLTSCSTMAACREHITVQWLG